MTRIAKLCLVLLVFILAPLTANAGPLLVIDGDGNLVGAENVNVGGGMFDVSFIDGSCIGLFDGCDEAADFVFGSSDEAEAASLALLEQVFIDGLLGEFDSFPILTAGCDSDRDCLVYTPYAPLIPGFDLLAWYAVNDMQEDHDGAFPVPLAAAQSSGTGEVWAVWSRSAAAVAEPSTLALLGIGLFGMGAARRKKA